MAGYDVFNTKKKLFNYMARRARHCVKNWNTVILFKYFCTFLYLSFTETLKKKYNCYPDCCTGCPNEHRNSVTILICLCKWSFDLVMPIKEAVICLLELITYFFFMFLLHTSDIRNSCLQTQTTVVPFQCLSCKNVKEHNSLLQFAWNIL